ncbi:cytochrome P450 [Nocardia sp. NPDC004711]
MTSHELARAVLGDQRFTVYPGGPPSMHPERQAALVFDAIQHDTDFPDVVRGLIDRYRREGRLADAFRDLEVVRTLHERSLSKLPFFMTDPPEHTRLRRIVAPHFAVRRVGEYRTRIEKIVADRLDVMEKLGPPVDLVETFAQAIPSLMTCALFGVPESERGTFEQLAAVRHNSDATVDDVVEARREFRAFGRELIERKRAQPGDDLLSALVHNGAMTEDELVSTAVVLVTAAHGTTANALASSIFTLLQNRERWNTLRTESAPIGHIVEELLRYTTIDQANDVRTALEDVEIGDAVIKASEPVAISLSAANRDPQVFAEPDRVDLTRHAANHLTFGYGVHQCIGQHLARLELQIALTGLARRFPNLDLAVPVADIPWHSGDRQLYGPRKLPVTW